MLVRIASTIGIAFILFSAYIANAREQSNSVQQPINSAIATQPVLAVEEVTQEEKPIFRRDVVESIKPNNYMLLKPTKKKNVLGNPLYELRLYANGNLVSSYITVTGRNYTQKRNRDIAGTEAPLPDGVYLIATSTVPGTFSEVGARFLPIEPLFNTGRGDLGIHVDPSFQKVNGEDGTSGCVGLTNESDLDEVLNYVASYQPQYLEVRIQPQ